MFEKIKRFFNLKIYTVKQIRQFCDKGVITPEQFTEITGEEY
ncbi:MAG: XkdX family protein [Clostridia bacterium]|nr:XkdX family protein [Clostridia bacterium]